MRAERRKGAFMVFLPGVMVPSVLISQWGILKPGMLSWRMFGRT